MNERTIQLYKQAVDFAYTTAGEDAGKGTIIESLTAGKFAELIVAEAITVLQKRFMGDLIGKIWKCADALQTLRNILELKNEHGRL